MAMKVIRTLMHIAIGLNLLLSIVIWYGNGFLAGLLNFLVICVPILLVFQIVITCIRLFAPKSDDKKKNFTDLIFTDLPKKFDQLSVQSQKDIEKNEIRLLVDKHRFELEKQMANAVKRSPYGTIKKDNRVDVIMDFLNDVRPPEPDGLNPNFLTDEEKILTVFEHLGYKLIERQDHDNGVNWEFEYEETGLDSDFDPKSAPIDGFDFEHWVAKNLRKYGWEADVTQGSADQGIDVICKKSGKTVAVQCKRYSGSVSNKAVQEAIAGAQFYGADMSIVISTGNYTKSAKELAKVSNVSLFSEYDIPKIHEKLSL